MGPGLTVVGGPSGPTLSAQVPATRHKSIGPEGPPATGGPAAESAFIESDGGAGVPAARGPCSIGPEKNNRLETVLGA
ncbi:DUF6053 domain-containing protein [Lysobacter enzymogenes]|uniref:DUF6053 domain-containing protein n=1 Tax=Lysobacter enzymogenes TaxID=69 RepID=UPI003D18EE5A